MKKKKILIVLIIIFLVLIVVFVVYPKFIVSRGNYIYGTELCTFYYDYKDPFSSEDGKHLRVGLPVVSRRECELCNITYTYGSSPTPEICKNCSKITGRCAWCGKLFPTK